MSFPGKLHVVSTVVAGLLTIPLCASANTVVCKQIRLKPLHCVRGFVIDPLGEFVPGATVTIIEKGAAQAVSKTDEKGQFSFGVVESGNYELRVETEGFLTEHIPIVVNKPKGRCKRGLEIRLRLAYPAECAHVRVVKE
jgi:Carboxypeptidase regulatory-like domain